MSRQQGTAKVVIIGALGRIGAAAGTALTRAGHQVTGLARNPQGPAAGRLPFEVRPLRLDLPASLAGQLAGADMVAYCAGAHHGAVSRIHEMDVFEINALAAVRTALAAAYCGTPRFVYLSSTAAMAMQDQAGQAGAYVRSKWLAETLLTAMAYPRALTVLRLGWVLDPSDEVAYRQLWPPSGLQVIVGELPVPMVGLHDVSRVLELLARPEHMTDPALSGSLDLVGGCPTQRELYQHAGQIALDPLRVIDARTVGRVVQLSRRGGSAEPPTWLTQSVPVSPMDWAAYGISLASWQSQVSELRQSCSLSAGRPAEADPC
jgi:uncharacterized protein YbjT (DUF2867 family)